MLIEEAGHCGRCRPDMGAGVVCRHCKLDELFIKWEVRLFSPQTRYDDFVGQSCTVPLSMSMLKSDDAVTL